MSDDSSLTRYGFLTGENIKEVAELVRRLLTDKVFTFVTIHPHNNLTPVMHTGRHLVPSCGRSDGVRVTMNNVNDVYTLEISDNEGIVRVTTMLKYETPDNHTMLKRAAYYHFENDTLIFQQQVKFQPLYFIIGIEQPTPAMLDFATTLKESLQDPDMPEEIKAKLQASAEAAKLLVPANTLA